MIFIFSRHLHIHGCDYQDKKYNNIHHRPEPQIEPPGFLDLTDNIQAVPSWYGMPWQNTRSGSEGKRQDRI